MRKISAQYLFDGHCLIKNGLITLGENNEILDVCSLDNSIQEQPNIEFYNGILIPGMINSHSHLELSYLKGKFKEHLGLDSFISQMISSRTNKVSDLIKESAIEQYDAYMYKTGTSVVADIVNSDITIKTKTKSNIFYYNLIEGAGSNFSVIERRYSFIRELQQLFIKNNLKADLVPHAIYSVHIELFKKFLIARGEVLSLHFLESELEAALYDNQKKSLLNVLRKIDKEYEIPELDKYLKAIINNTNNKNLMFVHNVEIDEKIFDTLSQLKNSYFVLCPLSNMFISSRLPNLNLFPEEVKSRLLVGTDSLVSNHKLSLIDELKEIALNYDNYSLVELFKMVTSNPAKALKIQNNFGEFRHGIKPGVTLIYDIDLLNLKLTKNTKSKRII